MGKTLILAIDELAQGQVQAFQTVNDMAAALEQAANKPKSISTTGNYSLAELDLVRYGAFLVSGMTADITFTIPSTVNSNTTQRIIWIANDSGTYDIAVNSGGASVTVPTNAIRAVLVSGTTCKIIAEGGKVLGVPHTTAFFAAGHPTHDSEVLRYSFIEEVLWADDMVGSLGSVEIAPSPEAFFYIYKNGSKVGYTRISTGGAVTFKTDASTIAWAVGDVLVIKFEALQVGTIVFSSVADSGDDVTIDNGTDTPVTFTFGGGGGQVAPGGSATDSATNLRAAIETSAIASSLLVEQAGTSLKIFNLLEARGGSISKTDADNDYTVTDFSSDSTSENYGIVYKGTRT